MGFSSIYRLFRPLFILGRQAAAGEERRRISNILKLAVCYNQGKLAEYAYTAAEKHKELKSALASEILDKGKVKDLKASLENYLYDEFITASEINFDKIVSYFNGRSHRDVRVCVKVISGDLVVDPNIRNKPLYITPSHKPIKNTGFYEVDRTGREYICNDIPDKARLGSYINPRLYNHIVSNYKETSFQSLKYIINRNYIDNNWCNCWAPLDNEAGNIPSPADSCYKSTMIVPMTLIGNTLSKEFKDRFNIKEFHDKAIYGFLCLDHQEKNYFSEEDVSVCYIFSDLLSLYLIHSMIYTTKSKTFKNAVEVENK